MRHILLLPLALVGLSSVGAQDVANGSFSIPCAVRIRPIASADYDLSNECVLRGEVTAVRDRLLKVRLTFGVIHIEIGNGGGHLGIGEGQRIEVLACKRQEGLRQWFIAREIRTSSGVLVLRDAQGVPLL
jgi:hypothetical protein